MLMQADVVVVGGGPAGMAAATAAAEAGASVIMLDEYAKPGGQFFKRTGDGFSVAPERLTREHARGEALREKLRHLNIRVLTRALVWGRFDDRVMVAHEGRSKSISGKALVIATGAYDRPVAFPGWTLPGVITAGGAQTLAKSQWVKPGQRMLLAGAGPFLLPVAQSLLRAEVKIAALVEATRPIEWLPHIGALWGQWPRFSEAWEYRRNLARDNVPTIYGHKIVRAIGEDHVKGAVIAKVDRDWRAILGTERTIEVDAIATGYGFLANIELAASCGCELSFDSFARSWFVRCSPTMATNLSGVFVAGEITGIGGSALALEEGRIAGLSAAEFVGALSSGEADDQRRQPIAERVHLDRFASALNRLFGPRPGLWEYLKSAMTVCRCEEVKAAEIEACVANGASTNKAIKDWTRAGMGLCEGRICRAMVSEIVARERRVELGTIPFPSVRPPIKPVPISTLLQDDSQTESIGS
jgi:D-hydroxyproline dehydrogenase subunit alpha